jgi:hypothetical protein
VAELWTPKELRNVGMPVQNLERDIYLSRDVLVMKQTTIKQRECTVCKLEEYMNICDLSAILPMFA